MATQGANRGVQTVYLVRHGEAKSKDEDPERPLTEHGRGAVERMAIWSAAAGFQVDRMLHSGKLRAEQTAELLAGYLRPAPRVQSASGLGPNDDVQPVAESLQQQDGSIMLVGHLPFLERLASFLLIGDADRSLVDFEAGALVALTQQGRHWTIRCVIQPHLLR